MVATFIYCAVLSLLPACSAIAPDAKADPGALKADVASAVKAADTGEPEQAAELLAKDKEDGDKDLDRQAAEADNDLDLVPGIGYLDDDTPDDLEEGAPPLKASDWRPTIEDDQTPVTDDTPDCVDCKQDDEGTVQEINDNNEFQEAQALADGDAPIDKLATTDAKKDDEDGMKQADDDEANVNKAEAAEEAAEEKKAEAEETKNFAAAIAADDGSPDEAAAKAEGMVASWTVDGALPGRALGPDAVHAQPLAAESTATQTTTTPAPDFAQHLRKDKKSRGTCPGMQGSCPDGTWDNCGQFYETTGESVGQKCEWDGERCGPDGNECDLPN